MDNKPAPLPYHVGMLAINIGCVEIGDANARRVATLNIMDTKNPLETANFIVKACNNHDKLVEALQMIVEVGRKSHENPKYDHVYEIAHIVLKNVKPIKLEGRMIECPEEE